MTTLLRKVLLFVLNHTSRLYPDKLFLILKFYLRNGEKLNLKSPQTFMEKLQWLKLYARDKGYTKMVDKISAKEYVASIIGQEYVIPTIKQYNSVDEIDFASLPNQFVLKCSHDSGGVVVCKDKNLLERLHKIVDSSWEVIPYTKAVEILEDAKNKGHHFDNENIFWGMDLQSEHERYITEQVVKGPTWIIDYPKEAKAFYMKQNPDGKTVAAYDLLVPEIGELIGGSQREDDYEKLRQRMEECHLLKDDSALWYLNTRRFGGCVHSGFGIGFDRFLMLLTGLNNIRDVQLYPRTANQVKY